MIFELLDAKRKRIATVTDKNLVDGTISRDLDDRFVKDSIEVEFSLNMKDLLDEAMFLMVSDTGYLRGSPVFRVYQKEIRDTIKVVATSYTTEDLGGYLVNVDELFNKVGDKEELIKEEFNKTGFNLILDGVSITDEKFKLLDYQLPNGEVGIGEVLNELMLILDVYGEFVFTAEKDEVVSVGIRLAKRLGRNVKRGLIDGVNITNRRVEERIEDIVTAVEYTGEETVDSSGKVTGVLRLIDTQSALMPKSKRWAYVRRYEDENGESMYILNDLQATNKYGKYNYNTGKMLPIVERYSDVYINNREDLLKEAVAKLDGKSVPKTQYNISANVSGLDVGDVVEVQIPQLKVDRYLDVISVTYSLNRKGRVNVTVGEHIPTELERRFDEIGVDNKAEVGGLPVDLERGQTVSTPILPRTVIYAGGDYGNNDKVLWVENPTIDLRPYEYDYYLSFDYTLNGGYNEGYVELVKTTRSNDANHRYVTATKRLPDNTNHMKLTEIPINGSRGSVEVRLNDFREFMRESNSTFDNNIFPTNWYIIPYLSVYDELGQLVTVNWLDQDKPMPTTPEELEEQSGYLTNFTITEHERNMRDPEDSEYITQGINEQLTLALEYGDNTIEEE